MTMDPYAGSTTRPQTLHKYIFAGADPVNKIDACGMAEAIEYGGISFWMAVRALAVAAELSFAISCVFYRVASILDPNIIPLIPPPFQACAADDERICRRLLDLCLDNPWQPDWNKDDFGPKKDCGACYRECKRRRPAFINVPIFKTADVEAERMRPVHKNP